MTAIVPNPTHPALDRQPQVRGNGLARCQEEGDDQADDAWGDVILPKAPSTIRVALQNIQGLPILPYSEKHRQITSCIDLLQIDNFGIAEINLNFPQLPSSHQWRERFKKLISAHSIYATNTTHITQEKILFGGTAQLSTGMLGHRAIASGVDPSGLGRWCWTRFIGRHNTHLRIITGYRPTPNTQSDGPMQVANQHEIHLLSQDDDRDARQAFLEDLDKEIQTWIQNGDAIILSLDANAHVRLGAIHRMIQRWGLIDAHYYCHPNQTTVATCAKNQSNVPIDGMWTSPSIDILAAGYSGFGEYPIGNADHRLLWIDVSTTSCFGIDLPRPIYRQPRRLTLQDPRVVKRYNRILQAEMERHRLPQRANRVYHALPAFSLLAKAEYEKIAELDVQCRRFAEKRCRKLHMGQVPFSDTLRKADQAVQLWLLLRKKRTGNRASVKKIRRLMRQCQQMDAMEVSLPVIYQRLTESRTQYKSIKRQASEHRIKFRDRLNRAKAKSRGIPTKSQKTITANTERQRIIARRVRALSDRHSRTAFQLLDEPTPTGRRLCQDKVSIEQACMNEGRRRFTQSANTPFLQAPLLNEIGYLADLPGADTILDGTFFAKRSPDAPILDEITQKFIHELRRDPQVPDLATGFLSAEAHRKGWRRMKPTTSSSTFGPGFIDYIAGSYNAIIAEFDATMSSIPFLSGYSPQAWSSAIDVMIPKKARTLEVEKLRIIVLYHALFNQANKNVGRLLIRHAELLNQIPWEAYGSRRHHRSIECALNKVLTADLWRQTRRPGALCSNDAKSCYDRIAHSVAILCMRRLGLSEETCHVMIGTLEQVKHYVRTTYGDSTTSYQGIEIPFQGIGQGNGAGPAIWLIVSVPIINMLKTAGFGLRMRTPISKDEFEFVCYTFVDDTDLVHSPSADISSPQLIVEMQQVLNHWEGGLRASGGALVPSKSYWYLVDFTWRNDSWHYKSIADQPGDLSIRDSDHQPINLERLEVSEARETLGVWLAMDGNQKLEFSKLRDIAARWADKVRCGQLNAAEAWFALQQTVMKSLEYPLMATTLSRSQCDEIMRTLLNAALPRLHIAMSFPNAVRFGPRAHHGLGIPHLWTTQGIDKLWAIFRHGDDDTITGHQIRCSLECAMLESGIPHNLLSWSYKDLHQLCAKSWISSLWEFVQSFQFSLSDNVPEIPLQCDNDRFLIPEFLLTGLSPKTIQQANLCRLWLRVWRLSDISTGDGQAIQLCYWQGLAPSSLTDQYDWPRSERPSTSAWNAWRQALQSLTHGPNRVLRSPLRSWICPPGPSQDWFLSEEENRLYKATPNGNLVYLPVHLRANRRPRFAYHHTSHEPLPVTCARTSTYTSGGLHIQHTGTRLTAIPPPPTSTHWAVERLSLPLDIQPLLTAIQNHEAFGLCDGSYKLHHGTAAFALQTGSARAGRILGSNQTPGAEEEQNSFRSELGGIYGIVIVLKQLCQTHHIIAGGIEIACDCFGALQAVFTHEWDDPSQSSFDLIHQIRREIQASPLTWTWRHVKGHQDQHTRFDALDWRSQLNVEMDSLAKAYWNATFTDRTTFYDADPTMWRLSHSGRQFSSLDRKLLYELCHGPPLRAYWRKKYNLSEVAINTIDWKVCDDGIRRLDIFQRIWLAKMTTNTAPTGQILHRRGHQSQPICPRCGQYEDISHVIRCNHPAAIAKWHSGVLSLRAWLERQATSPPLTHLLCQSLLTWHANLDGHAVPIPAVPEPLLTCFTSQNEIGWHTFLLGFISTHWISVQQAYYTQTESRRTGFRWV